MAGTPEHPQNAYSKVVVVLKEELYDPQGEALSAAARRMGFAVNSIRQGKVFQLTHKPTTIDTAESTARDLADRLLASPVTEDVREIRTVTDKADLFTGNVPKPKDPTV